MMFLNIIKDLFNFEEAVKNNDFLGILIFIIFILGFLTVYFYKLNRKTEKENKKELKEIQEDIFRQDRSQTDCRHVRSGHAVFGRKYTGGRVYGHSGI